MAYDNNDADTSLSPGLQTSREYDMNSLFSLLHYIGIDDIFGILSLIGLASFLVRRFVLHKSPVPSGTFG